MWNKDHRDEISHRIKCTRDNILNGGGDTWNVDILVRDFAWMLFPDFGETVGPKAAKWLKECGFTDEEIDN